MFPAQTTYVNLIRADKVLMIILCVSECLASWSCSLCFRNGFKLAFSYMIFNIFESVFRANFMLTSISDSTCCRFRAQMAVKIFLKFVFLPVVWSISFFCIELSLLVKHLDINGIQPFPIFFLQLAGCTCWSLDYHDIEVTNILQSCRHPCLVSSNVFVRLETWFWWLWLN